METSFPLAGIKCSIGRIEVVGALLCYMEMSCEYSCPSHSTGYNMMTLRELTAKIIDAEQSNNDEHKQPFRNAIGVK